MTETGPPIDDRLVWAAAVIRKVHDLPARQSQALRLVYYQRLSQADAARRLAVTVEEMRRLVSSGLRALSQRLILD